MKKCCPIKTGNLSARERKILEEFKDNFEIIKEYDGYTFEEIKGFKEDPAINEIFNDYKKALFKAIRANLHNHPLVPTAVKSVLLEWIYTRRRLGKKKLLRKVKRGLEVGIKCFLTIEQVEFMNAVREMRLWEKKIETSPDIDVNNASTLEEIFKEIRLTRIYDPDNPPHQSRKPRPWTEIHRKSVNRGIAKTSRQVFLRKIRRLSPGLLPRPKKSQNHSE